MRFVALVAAAQAAAISFAQSASLAPAVSSFQMGSDPTVGRYGGMYDFSSHQFAGVAGFKVKEIDLGSKRFLNPEVWGLGGVTFGSGSSKATFNVAVAEPWVWSPTITAYPFLGLGVVAKGTPHLGLGGAIQIRFKS